MSISPGKPRLLKKTHCYASFRSYISSDIKATCEMGMCIGGGKWVWIITRLLYREEKRLQRGIAIWFLLQASPKTI